MGNGQSGESPTLYDRTIGAIPGLASTTPTDTQATNGTASIEDGVPAPPIGARRRRSKTYRKKVKKSKRSRTGRKSNRS